MSYSIPSSTKIPTLETAPFLFILLGTLCVCEFAFVPEVYILLRPPGRKGALLFLRAQIYIFSSTIIKNI